MKKPPEFDTASRRDRLIVNSSPLIDKTIDAELAQAALNARRIGSSKGRDLFGLREVMTQLMASSGGRPGIAGAVGQVKIPRITADGERIEQIAARLSNLPHKPSVTQTAACIIHVALLNAPQDYWEKAIEKEFSDL